MKTLRIFKSTVSMILALIMLVSMCTVAIVGTSAAETDAAQTGAGTTVYFQNNWKWTDVRIHVWDSSQKALAGNWPGTAMTKIGTHGDYDFYKYTLPTNAVGFIFNGIKNDGSGARDQSPDMTTIPTNDHFYYMTWNNGNQCVQANESITVKFPSEGGGTTDPDNPFEYPDWNMLAFRDDTSDSIDNDYDTNIFVSFDNGTTKTAMTKTVDAMSGHDMWVIDKPATAPTTVNFYGVKATDKKFKGSALYTWTATYSGCTTGLYCATSTSAGKWGGTAEPYAVPAKDDINNLSFGIWADIKGDGNTFDCVVARKISSSEFDLYLPSNTPNPIKLYTSFASLKIGSTTVTDGTAVTLDAGTSYSISYTQTEYDTSEKPATLNVYRTLDSSSATEGVATLLLHTERPLFTELAVNMAGEYKDYKEIDTSGTYYMYDENGEWVNTPKTEDDGSITHRTKLKKIKGRGNSTFEASMKLYGKYAYNINLDETIELIDGAQKSKKWCLLANNVDHSMMRNTFIYSLGDDIGLKYSPETRLVNLYNNGSYLGAYVITEKVEYGKNTLMHGTDSLDKYHEELFNDEEAGFDYEDNIEKATDTHNGVSYQYAKGTGDFTFEHTDETYKDYNFLLEFELQARYKDEYSWFVSPKGQAVVVKYPEFATQNEMKWIIDQFVAVENAVYNKDYDTYKELIDVDSFAKMYLIQELTKNLDSASTSYYIHNDLASGKLAASPVWDYDWSMGSYYKYKPVYGGTNSDALDNPEQWFVKNKPMNTDPWSPDGSNTVYNFQAQLAQQSDFWEVCQKIWTNDMYAAIDNYVDTDATGTADGGIIVDEWFDRFKSALDMNFARWNGYGSNGNTEEWGTKKTNNYKYGSYNFSKGSGTISGTTATSDWGNTIYYLNDWLAKRSKWMNDNGLYNASLVDPYELNGVTMDATQSGNTVTVSVDLDATYDGEQITDDKKRFELYVNGSLEGDYAITETPVVTLEENVETKIYVVAYLTDDKDAYNIKSDSEKFTYSVTGPEYKIDGVSFTAVQNDSTLTVTPSATVTCDGETVAPEKVKYTVYLNGKAVANYNMTKTSVDITLEAGVNNEVYIVVAPVDNDSVSSTSAKQYFPYAVEVEKVTFTVKFKSPNSYRYIPTITAGDAQYKMTVDGDAIGKNASGTQKYFWYTADVTVDAEKKATLTFTNALSLRASISFETFAEGDVYYFAVDNLNNGTSVVDLTNEENEYIKNFAKSATHMVTNDPEEAGVATTSIDGTIYKMGDTDEDNKLTIVDATTLQLALVEKTELSDVGQDLADFDLNGTTSITDATNIQINLAQG